MEITYPKRKSPRLKDFDYATPNYYFVTICTHEKKCLFGKPEQLNTFGKYAESGFLGINKHFPKCKIDKFVVMPNHVHAIIVIQSGESSLSTIVGSYKSYVAKQIHAHHPNRTVWQSSFHDHVIRNQAGYEKIWTYIDSNPLKWNDDCYFQNM